MQILVRMREIRVESALWSLEERHFGDPFLPSRLRLYGHGGEWAESALPGTVARGLDGLVLYLSMALDFSFECISDRPCEIRSTIRPPHANRGGTRQRCPGESLDRTNRTHVRQGPGRTPADGKRFYTAYLSAGALPLDMPKIRGDRWACPCFCARAITASPPDRADSRHPVSAIPFPPSRIASTSRRHAYRFAAVGSPLTRGLVGHADDR